MASENSTGRSSKPTAWGLRLNFEAGRAITGPYGFLVAKVLHIKDTYKKFAGLDACMVNLMRPALYGAYHHITVAGKESGPLSETYDVTGSLCENNDKFAIDRALPVLERGDLVVIHDTGAHGHAMGFNYNGKLKSAELLLRENGEVVQIRRAETIEDYFATLDFGGCRILGSEHMKIAFDAKRAYLNKAGLGNYSRNTLVGLNKYYPQHQYLLFTPKVRRDIFKEYPFLKR